MKSGKAGNHTSQIEVLNISQFGFWLSLDGDEHFLPFDKFPWFREARISDIINVELLHHSHLYWPSLDIDLELESIVHPEKYPLVYRA
ncbi:MAG: DUF2442 domain-containing protein [Candidatus Eremiobacteraeota bacterium]|nr:DUF2442 domain-containing protein [Candidatus Eremiobacteraeota bacterium]